MLIEQAGFGRPALAMLIEQGSVGQPAIAILIEQEDVGQIQRRNGECAGGWCDKAVGATTIKIARKIIGSSLGLQEVK